MNDEDNNQTPTNNPTAAADPVNSVASTPVVPEAPATEPAATSVPQPAVEPAQPSDPVLSPASSSEPSAIVPLASDYTPPAFPSSPDEVPPEMVVDFLSKQSSTNPENTDQPSGSEIPTSHPVPPAVEDIWATNPDSSTPESNVPSVPTTDTEPVVSAEPTVVAEPIIPTPPTDLPAENKDTNSDEPKKKNGWMPVIVLGLLVIVAGIIVLILLASSQTAGNNQNNVSSSVSSTISSTDISGPVTPDGWIEFTDGLMGIKFALPEQTSYVEVQIPQRTPAYTDAEIAVFQAQPPEWYYVPSGTTQFAGSELEARYLTLNRAPGRASGIGVLCDTEGLCNIDIAVNIYKVAFPGSLSDFVALFENASTSSSITSSFSSTASPTPTSLSSTTSSSNTTAVSGELTPNLFGFSTQKLMIEAQEYYVLKQGNFIYAVSIFTANTELATLANQVVNALDIIN